MFTQSSLEICGIQIAGLLKIQKSKDAQVPYTKWHSINICIEPTHILVVKRLSTMWETWVLSLGREDPLEKEMLPSIAGQV